MVRERGPVELHVYVEAGCSTCRRAVDIARKVDGAYAGVAVRVIDTGRAEGIAADVFAVPTFVLDGKLLSLGNPREQDLQRAIEAALRPED